MSRGSILDSQSPANARSSDSGASTVVGIGAIVREIERAKESTTIDAEQIFVLAQRIQGACARGDWPYVSKALLAVSVMARNASETMRVAGALHVSLTMLVKSAEAEAPSKSFRLRANKRLAAQRRRRETAASK